MLWNSSKCHCPPIQLLLSTKQRQVVVDCWHYSRTYTCLKNIQATFEQTRQGFILDWFGYSAPNLNSPFEIGCNFGKIWVVKSFNLDEWFSMKIENKFLSFQNYPKFMLQRNVLFRCRTLYVHHSLNEFHYITIFISWNGIQYLPEAVQFSCNELFTFPIMFPLLGFSHSISILLH